MEKKEPYGRFFIYFLAFNRPLTTGNRQLVLANLRKNRSIQALMTIKCKTKILEDK